MSADPSISVIIPTRDREVLLERALNSVLRQTWQDLEVLVVDDASEDGTESKMNSHRDPRVRYFRLPEASGAPAARNVGIASARGRLIAFLDSDDEFLPAKLERQQAEMTAHNSLASICWFVEAKEGQSSLLRPPSDSLDWGQLMGGPRLWITTGQLLASAVLLQREMFDEALVAFQDWDLFVRLSRTAPIMCVPEPLLTKHEHHGPRVFQGSRRHEALGYLSKKYAEEIREDARRTQRWDRLLAISAWENGNMKAVRHYLTATLRERRRPWLALWLLCALGGRRAFTGFLRVRSVWQRTRWRQGLQSEIGQA